MQSALFQRKSIWLTTAAIHRAGIIETYKLMMELEPLNRQLLAIQKELNVKKSKLGVGAIFAIYG